MTESFKRVMDALDKLPTAIQERVVVGATRATAKVVADEAKRLAPVDTGRLKLSIGVAKAKKKDTKENHVKFYAVPKTKLRKTISAVVDGKSAKLKTLDYAYHAHFVEFGTSKMSARPFLRPAVENTLTESVKAFQDYALKRVDKEIEKLK